MKIPRNKGRLSCIRMTLLMLVSLLTLSHATASQDSASEDLVLEYRNLESRAVNGTAKEKHDVFVFAYEHATLLSHEAPRALQFLLDAANLGYSDAQYNLGYLLMTGTWITRNEVDGLYWLSRAAENNNISAQLWCGQIYLDKAQVVMDAEDRSHYNNYVQTAIAWLRAASASSDSLNTEVLEARKTLGVTLIGESISNEEGWNLVRDAANFGYEPAQEVMSELLELLNEGVAQGDETAKYLLSRYGDASNAK